MIATTVPIVAFEGRHHVAVTPTGPQRRACSHRMYHDQRFVAPVVIDRIATRTPKIDADERVNGDGT